MPDIAELGIVVGLTGGDKALAQLDAIGVAGEKAGAKVASSLAPASTQTQTLAASTLNAASNVNAFASSTTRAELATTQHALAMGKIERAFVATAEEALGLNAAVGLLGEGFGKMVASELVVVGVIAAVAALAKTWELWTADAKRAREEQEKLTQALDDWYRTERAGVAGERSQQLAAAQARLAENQEKLDALQAQASPSIRGGRNAGADLVEQGQITALQKIMDDERKIIAAAQADITKTLTNDFVAQQGVREQQLEAIVQNDHATAAERASARKQLQADLVADAALMHQYLASSDPNLHAQAAAIAGNIQSITQALAPNKKALEEAAATARLYDDVMTDLAGRIKGTTVELSGYTKTALALNTASNELGQMVADDADKMNQIAAANAKATKTATDLTAEVHDLAHAMRDDLLGGMIDLAGSGLTSFSSFVTGATALSSKLVSDLSQHIDTLRQKQAAAIGVGDIPLAAQIQQQIAAMQSLQPLAGRVNAGLSGFSLGSSLGAATGSAVGGAVTGAATGAGEGFMLAGPMGALVGGISGLVGGFLSGASAAETLAKSVADMQRQFKLALLTMEQGTGDATTLEVALAKLDESTQQLIAQAFDADIFHGDDLGLKQFAADAKKIEEQSALTAQQLREQAALDKKTQQESLQARLLRAQGDDAAADALDLQVQQEQERLKLVQSFGSVIDPTEAATLAMLDQVQAAEKVKAATDALNASNENLAAGYKLNLELFKYSPALGPGDSPVPGAPPPIAPPPGSGRPSVARPTPQPLVVNVQLDGKTVARKTLTVFQDASQDQYGTTDRWSEVVEV